MSSVMGGCCRVGWRSPWRSQLRESSAPQRDGSTGRGGPGRLPTSVGTVTVRPPWLLSRKNVEAVSWRADDKLSRMASTQYCRTPQIAL
jgi:hypothetical protein